MGHANRVCDLHFAAIRQSRRYDIFNRTRRIRRGSIDFGWILTGEGAAAVARHAAVRVGDNLAPRQSGVAFRAADDETSGWVHIDARRLVVHRRRKHVIDDALGDLAANLFKRNFWIVLRRNDDRFHAHRTIAVVLHRHLRLTVGTQIRNRFPLLRTAARWRVRLCASTMGSGISSLGFAARVPEHHALVAGSGTFELFVVARARFEATQVNAHCDVG